MAYIWRLSAIGLAKETTSWTRVNPQVWIPKETWVLNPSFEEALDTSGYGVIDEVYDSQTTKNSSNITLWGIVRDDFIWYLLLWALWQYKRLYCCKVTELMYWMPKRWDMTFTGAMVYKVLKMWDDLYLFFDQDITWGIAADDDSWALTMSYISAVKVHYFTRLNSNQHPSFTIYDDDPNAASYAPYCMINSFELSCEVSDYVKFSAEFMGKQMQPIPDWLTLTPAYSDEAPFLANMAWVKFASDETGLNDASEQCMQNFRLTINKNLTDIQCFGSTDVDSIYNQQFGIDWDFEALYESTTLRDYVINSEKKALRFYAENTGVAALWWNIHPSIYVDVMKVGLNEWTKTDSNDEIIQQTMWFTGQYDNNTWASIEVLLLNDNSEGY